MYTNNLIRKTIDSDRIQMHAYIERLSEFLFNKVAYTNKIHKGSTITKSNIKNTAKCFIEWQTRFFSFDFK